MGNDASNCSARSPVQSTKAKDARSLSRNRVSQGHAKTWEEMYVELQAYRERHGHCNVPQRDPQNHSLAGWVSRQRHSQDKVSVDRKQELDKLGFDWEKQAHRFERQWQEMYQRLVEYKQKHGTCNVPKEYKEDFKLGFWVSKQRNCYRNKTIRPDRRAKLERLDFEWIARPSLVWKEGRDLSLYDAMWHENYDKLEKFYLQHEHSIVPNTFVNGKNEPFGRWIRSQRSKYAEGTLSPERKEMLDQLDFVWRIDPADPQKSLTQRAWRTNFDRLRQFRAEHGHCRVPQKYKSDSELGTWVSVQRAAEREGWLDSRRRHALQRVGFEFNCTKGEGHAEIPSDEVLAAKEIGFLLSSDNRQVQSSLPRVISQVAGVGYPPGITVKKFFPAHGWFTGTVVAFIDEYYRVRYSDGDMEEYTADELKKLVSASPEVTDRHENRAGCKRKASSLQQPAPKTVPRKPDSERSESQAKKYRRSRPMAAAEQTTSCSVTCDAHTLQLGSRVEVYWESEQVYFSATVDKKSTENSTVHLHYDDGDDEWLDLRGHNWRPLLPLSRRVHVYECGTAVRKYFPGHGWFDGKIVANDGDYEVLYSDGDRETFELDSIELHAMVEKGSGSQPS